MISERSRKALQGVHPDLVKVIERADEMGAKFIVVCGLRTLAQQKEFVAQGKSKTLHSRHLTGHAVDVVDEKGTYGETELRQIAKVVMQAAADLGIPIEWGGDWKHFQDTPHFQLPFAQYPDGDKVAHITAAADPAPAVITQSANPLHKSGTIWGSIGTAFAGVGIYIEQSFQALVDAAGKWSEIGPARDMLSAVAGNGKALSLGLLAGCVVIIISRRVKAAQEGKPG
jgi:peptidoglycan L-alanyl-D-glutamate endopeptidase CwlK